MPAESDAERGLRLSHEIRDRRASYVGRDVGFMDAARRVGRAMAHGGEDPLAAGADLAEFLMSDRPLGEVERLILAELVLGEIRRSPRKPRLHPNHPDVAPVVALLRQVEASGSKRDAAVQQTAKTFRITPRTVRDREKIVLERERAEAEAKVNRREAQE